MAKKGFLLAETTIKIIIAVICIGFLVYLLFSLYYANVQEKKSEEATIVLVDSPESVAVALDRVRETGVSEEKHIAKPNGWNVFSYLGNEKKPNACVGDNCVCMCDEVSFDNLFGIVENRQLSECDEDGICLVVSDLSGEKLSVEIGSNTWIVITYANGFLEVSER